MVFVLLDQSVSKDAALRVSIFAFMFRLDIVLSHEKLEILSLSGEDMLQQDAHR